MATMESLIGLVNRIQRACTALGDYGGGDNNTNAFSSLWDALPSVAVVGGQVYILLLYFTLFNYLIFTCFVRYRKRRQLLSSFQFVCVFICIFIFDQG